MKSSSRLNLFDLTMIVVSLVIGMGIFRAPTNVAQQASSANMFFLAWIVGGLIALCGALCYAEIGSRYPVMGGYYKIFSYCYHPSIAFAINCIILVSNAASLAGVALIGSEYLANIFFTGSPDDLKLTKQIIATIAVIVFYGVNLMGLKMSSRTQNVLTVIKIGLVIFLISALFTGDYAAPLNPEPSAEADIMTTIRAFGACLVAVSFTYGGYQQTINFGGEVKNPAKILPKGIFFGIAIIMLLYLTINYTYYKVIGFENLKGAKSIAAILAGKLFGENGYTIVSVLLFLSVLAYVNALLLSNPRVMYAMSDEGVLPAVFKKVTIKKNVIMVSLSAFAALSLITLWYAETFDAILDHTIFLDSIGMATSTATIFILRKRGIGEDVKDSYRMKLYPLLPLIFIAAYIFIATCIAINTPKAAWVSALVFSVFFILYFVLRFFKKSPQAN